MTHARQMDDAEGDFSAAADSEEKCPKCGAPMKEQKWESSDGAFEDYRYSCTNAECGCVRWVEGPDA